MKRSILDVWQSSKWYNMREHGFFLIRIHRMRTESVRENAGQRKPISTWHILHSANCQNNFQALVWSTRCLIMNILRIIKERTQLHELYLYSIM